MLRKIIIKVKKVFLINKINKKYKCEISQKSNIDSLSFFEGSNIVYEQTSILKSEVGLATYISKNCSFYKTKIGRYCSIGPNVRIIAGNHPTTKYVSTHPIFYSNRAFSGLVYEHKNTFKEYSYTDTSERFLCEIGNDVWIGEDVKIVNGISIGDGAIVATGAVVSKNVPPYAIVGGVPAKIIKYRFSEEKINYLLNLKWWIKDEDWLKVHAKLFCDIENLLKTEE